MNVYRFFIKYPFRVLFPLILIFFTISIELIKTIYNVNKEFNSLEYTKVQSIRTSMDILQYSYNSSLKNEDNYNILRDIIASLSTDNYIKLLLLSDEKEYIFLSSKRKYEGYHLKELIHKYKFDFLSRYHDNFNKVRTTKVPFIKIEKDFILFVYPINIPERKISSLRPLNSDLILMHYDLVELKKETLYSTLMESLGSGTINIIAVMMIISFFYFLYGRRIKELIHATETLGTGNFDIGSYFRLEGQDELTSIGKAFKEMAIKIKSLAYYDFLTGAINRFSFEKEVDQFIEYTSIPFALFYIDLDGFKDVNDSLGHAIGDKLLLEVAIRIRLLIKRNALISRIGGDEFCILIKREMSESEITNFCKDLISEISEPFSIENNRIYLEASVGVACFPAHGKNFDTLLRNADTAMYQAKKDRKIPYVIFTSTLYEKAERRFHMLNALRKAIIAEEFQLVYQPVIDLTTKKMIAVEALIRWKSEIFGDVSPMEFIPLLEESFSMKKVGEWVLYEASSQAKIWENIGKPLHVNVNVSVQQLLDRDFYDSLLSILGKVSLHPSRLTLEITESEAMAEPQKIIKVLKRIGSLGISIAIDDFGTGYSSLSYLRNMPINFLKIDKSFVMYLEDNSKDLAIVKMIIGLAKNLNLQIVAEGVETIQIVNTLNSLDCNLGQGFYFSKPIKPDKIMELYDVSHF
ncbi:MAG: GGDEF domain-containing protein [Leptospiraceae bacterium]|nr:GGDEF domain-containing protein [Leptospiraceae bacterium]MCP5500691.1 GGDEF domain-containing protein [Leptospiraceae bacterium]